MDEKPVVFFVAALVVAPICAVCVLGPALVGGFLAGWFGWLADLDTGLVIVLGGLAAIGVRGFIRYRRKPRSNSSASNSGPPQ